MSIRQASASEMYQQYPWSDQSAGSAESRLPPNTTKRIKASDPAQEESIEHLKYLTEKASDVPLAQLAQKIKMLESNNPSIEDDPTFKSLNNPKYIKQERHHQLFGMVWVKCMCESSPTAVIPRNRIYARYVQLCADFNLFPLTPASFGKIIRILHPHLKTRRLGMRGKSKYHYCGIKLLDNRSLESSPLGDASPKGLDSPCSASPLVSEMRYSSVSSDITTPINSVSVRETLIINESKYIPNLFSIIDQSMGPDWMTQPFVLPSIQSHLAKGETVDSDIADTLYSLCHVHCMSLFESLRYMQVEKMLSLLGPFCNILTTPVFKLYTAESTSKWVKACDLAVYRAMLKMLTRLQLEPVPDAIVNPLRRIVKEYAINLAATLRDKFPEHFVKMKMTTARHFIAMLGRFLRTIEYGRSACKIVSSGMERSLMLSDWLRVDLKAIVKREVPCATDYESFFNELFNDRIIKLFEGPPQTTSSRASGLAPFAAFFTELPSRFPDVSPWLFLLVCSNFISTCLREMSLLGGQSFGSWWVLFCWADEFIMWFLELGGYLYDDIKHELEQTTEETEESIRDSESDNALWAFEPMRTESLGAYDCVDLLDGHNSESKQSVEGDWY